MLKKIAASLLALCMLICLSACNKEETSSDISSDVSQTETTGSQTDESSKADTNTDKEENSSTPQSSTSKPTTTTNSKTSSTIKPTTSTTAPSTSTPSTSDEPTFISSTISDIVVSLGNDIYISYYITLSKNGNCTIDTFAYKAVNRATATQSEIDKINYSLSGGANGKYYHEGAFIWSWGSMGAGVGSGNPEEPTTFEQLYTNNSMVKDSMIYGDICLVPTFILEIEPTFFESNKYTYTYNANTKTATINGGAKVTSIVVDGNNSKITVGNKTYDKTNNSFNAYLKNS